MKSAKYILAAFAALVVFASCGPTTPAPTRADIYPKFYEEKPLTMLIMPPINRSSNVAAKECLYASITRPLCEAGYYVIPPFMAMDVFRNESAYDAENFLTTSLKPFQEYFNCDAVVFPIIDTWTKQGFGIRTDLHYIIRSAHSGETMFDRTCKLYLDLSIKTGSTSGSGWGAILDLAISAANTAVVEHIVAARKANDYIFSDIPRGYYHPDYEKDRETTAATANIDISLK